MRRGHQKIFDIVILNRAHSLDSAAASVLGFEVIHSHTLNISQRGHRNDGIFIGNKIFVGNIIYVIADGGTSRIREFIADSQDFVLDDTE